MYAAGKKTLLPPSNPVQSIHHVNVCLQVLTPLSQITTHKIILFAKQVDRWAAHYKDTACPNVSVHPVGAAFRQALAECSGLIASPSPGVVVQALGCAKPCYLFIPPGHLEQTCNYNYYTKHFIGVASPLTESIAAWADRALAAPTSIEPRTWVPKLPAFATGSLPNNQPPMLAQAYATSQPSYGHE